MAADPDGALDPPPMLSAAERRQWLVEWNNTASTYPRTQSIHELFEGMVEQIPDAVAVVAADRTWTYGELNLKANQLAHRLRALGVGPEVLVGVCLERSFDAIVALLGILKAGGAYVPLDPEYPRERLAFMLADTQCLVLLTQRRLVERLSPHRAQVICMDTDGDLINHEPTVNPGGSSSGDQLAYVIYTSGSTGRPKGVMVPHRGVVRLVKNTNYVDLGPNEVMLQFASTSFDVSTFEIWGCLLNGARLVVFPPHTPSLEELGRAIVDGRITTLWLPAPLFQRMVEHQLESLSGVRQVVAGGDVLPVPAVTRFLQAPGHGRLINGYGPTENTTFTCCYPLDSCDQLRGSVPIGRPIANTQVYVLDRHLRPVPIGVAGELCTGGDGLARGYLNRPELTAEKFVRAPLATGTPDAIVYRTGDRVRYLSTGDIEFLGRMDLQVKIRGHRVEVGEIEAALGTHPALAASAVTVREGSSGDKQLAAWGVARSGAQVTASEVRRFLRQTLPEYMIPSHVTFLEQLPLLTSGKLDRQTLARLEPSRVRRGATSTTPPDFITTAVASECAQLLGHTAVSVDDSFFDIGGDSLMAMRLAGRLSQSLGVDLPIRMFFETACLADLAASIRGHLRHCADLSISTSAFTAPATREGHDQAGHGHRLDPSRVTEPGAACAQAIEVYLAGLWTELLGASQVSAIDDFFDLGGHSLLAMEVISRVRQERGVELTVRALFDLPRLQDLAAHIARTLQDRTVDAVLPTPAMERTTNLPLSLSQQRLWFLDQLAPGTPTYNVPYAVWVTGELREQALADSLTDLVRRHEILRTVFPSPDGRPVQQIQPAPTVALSVVDLPRSSSGESDEPTRLLAEAEARRPFDLATGPLLRATLFRQAPERHLLLFVFHHIVFDGWSERIWCRELSALYASRVMGRPPDLSSTPTVQYADHAIWQQSHLRGTTLESQLTYWTRKLSSAPTVLAVPTDRARGARSASRGATVVCDAPPELAEQILRLSRREHCTPFMVLLTAFQVLMHRASAQDDLLVAYPSAGRDRVHTADLIGFFVNTLVARSTVTDHSTFRACLAATRAAIVADLAHGDVPLEQLVAAVQPERRPGLPPLVQVMFAFEPAPRQTISFPGAMVESCVINTRAAKCDLSLLVEDDGNALRMSLEYDVDLFHGSTATRLCQDYQRLLESIVTNPDLRVRA